VETAIFLVLMAAALVVSAGLAASETAAFQIGRSDLASLQAPGIVKRALQSILSRRRQILVTVLFGNLVVNIFFMNLGQALAAGVAETGGPGRRLIADAAILMTLVLFGDVFPKTFAMHRPLRVAALTAVPLVAVERILRLPRIALTALADSLMRLFRAAAPEGELTPAELQEVLRVAAQKGELGMDEHEWLKALLDLDRVPVREVIVPRVEMTTFDVRDGRDAFLRLFAETRRNKIPVHEGNVDRILGYLSAKDLLTQPAKSLQDLVRPVTFLPESASIAAAMQQMKQAAARRLAIVVDEYGGTEGLVTQEDLVESVVGDLADEDEQRWVPVAEVAPGVFSVDAALPLHELERIFGAGPERRGIATVGGLVAATLERVPRVGDTVELGKVGIEGAAMRGRRPDRLLIRFRRPSSEAAG
jgi:CBS domain containing-hemolysin-like protein